MSVMKFEVKRRRHRIEIVPMIDVIFFLLIFFFMFSTLKEAQTGVEVELPKTAHMGQVEENVVVISIREGAQVYFGKDQLSLDQLSAQVNDELEKDAQTRFIVKPDASVPYEEIIKVTDVLASQGVAKPLWGVDRQQIPNQAKGL